MPPVYRPLCIFDTFENVLEKFINSRIAEVICAAENLSPSNSTGSAPSYLQFCKMRTYAVRTRKSNIYAGLILQILQDLLILPSFAEGLGPS